MPHSLGRGPPHTYTCPLVWGEVSPHTVYTRSGGPNSDQPRPPYQLAAVGLPPPPPPRLARGQPHTCQ